MLYEQTNRTTDNRCRNSSACGVVFCYQVAYEKMSKEYVYEFDLEKTVHRILCMAITHVRSEQSNSLLENILYINDFTNYCQR
jgi:hypothetical protein